MLEARVEAALLVTIEGDLEVAEAGCICGAMVVAIGL